MREAIFVLYMHFVHDRGLHAYGHVRIIRARFGGIAQLGERLHGMQEVSGSIPLTSTRKCKDLLPHCPHRLEA